MSSVIKAGRREKPVARTGFTFASLLAAPEPVEGELPEVAGPTPEEIAAQIIASAQSQAQTLIAAAQNQASQLEAEAEETGFARGEAEGRVLWEVKRAELDEQAQNLQQEREAFFLSAEPELVKLSVEIARKVLKQEIKQRPEAVLEIVRESLRRVKDREVRILVNPDDLETVREAQESLLGLGNGSSDIEIVSERRVGPGGCILETPGGNLDARIEIQLSKLEETLIRETEGSHDDAVGQPGAIL